MTAQRQAQLIERLSQFVSRERALIEARGKGGQHVGNSPSITPSVLKELERMLQEAALAAPQAPQEPDWCIAPELHQDTGHIAACFIDPSHGTKPQASPQAGIGPWLPIATYVGPQTVLLAVPYAGRHRFTVGYFHTDNDWVLYGRLRREHEPEPTHWMPLPPSPGDAA